MKKKISIIIPILNEGESIEVLIKRLNTVLKKNSFIFEIICVDDHSTDNSWRIIRRLSHIYPVVALPKKGKRGKSFSILEGIKKSSYDTIVTIDGDLQCPPEGIPLLYVKYKKGYSIVTATHKEYRVNTLRKILSKLFTYLIAKSLFGLPFDIQSGLKLFDKRILDSFPIDPGKWTFDLEFLVKAKHHGFKIAAVPIIFEERKYGKSKAYFLTMIFEIIKKSIELKKYISHTY